jgi:hypothetical protein
VTPAHAALRTRARFAAGWFPVSDPRLDALAAGFALLLNPGGAAAAAPTHTLPATATTP